MLGQFSKQSEPKIPISKTIILRVWEGDFGLPSIEPDCLALLTLFKIYRVNFNVRYSSMPQWYTIPSLQLDDVNITGNDIFTSAIKLCSTEFEMDRLLQSELTAYKNYFIDSFAPAFFINCWIQEPNFDYMTKTWFNHVIPFPFNYFYLKKRRQQAQNRFQHMVGRHSPTKCILQSYEKATLCLEDFSAMLDDGRPYFLGSVPTSLDAVVYSYLVITLNLPLPDPTLQNIVNSYKNLTRFARYMTQKYFPDWSLEYKYVQPVNSSNERATTKALVTAVLFASAAMFMYAYANGLIDPKISQFKFF